MKYLNRFASAFVSLHISVKLISQMFRDFVFANINN